MEKKMKESFAPSIVTKTGEVYYPTGDEWLFFFALSGCDWAKEALREKEAEFKRKQMETA